MKLLSNWREFAICANTKHSAKWISYDLKDIEYAKDQCNNCTVKKECAISAMQNNSFIGVTAGISEYEYLVYTWHEATREDESNWTTDNRALSELL